MSFSVQLLELQLWQHSFYAGQQLKAEVQLLAAAFVKDLSQSQLVDGCVTSGQFWHFPKSGS